MFEHGKISIAFGMTFSSMPKTKQKGRFPPLVKLHDSFQSESLLFEVKGRKMNVPEATGYHDIFTLPPIVAKPLTGQALQSKRVTSSHHDHSKDHQIRLKVKMLPLRIVVKVGKLMET